MNAREPLVVQVQRARAAQAAAAQRLCMGAACQGPCHRELHEVARLCEVTA